MKFNNIQRLKATLLLALALLSASGCKKLIEVNAPVTSINGANVFNDNATAIAVLTGEYGNFYDASYPGMGRYLNTTLSLASDELALTPQGSAADQAYYQNAYTPQNIGSVFPWQVLYNFLYVANSTIEGLNASTALDPAVKKQLLAEQYFLRGMYFFYLTNLYGNVPLTVTSNYKTNMTLTRAPEAQVYEQIESDLSYAKDNLATNFVSITLTSSTQDRLRPTKWAAEAMLARVYLYEGKYSQAETMATDVINQSSLFSLTSLSNVFQKNSMEAIWQFQPTNATQYTIEAVTFVIPPTGLDAGGHVYYLSPFLINSFEPGDQRKTAWVGTHTDNTVTPAVTYYYANKYKSAFTGDAITENSDMLRLAEQYLIRAEARAMQNNPAGAVDDLNMIRQRAGLAAYSGATDQASLQAAILHERHVEFFTEYGHRWFDLKRTGQINNIMPSVCAAKGGTWAPYKALLPLTTNEVLVDQNLTQTPGY